jgi:hypothetical protein
LKGEVAPAAAPAIDVNRNIRIAKFMKVIIGASGKERVHNLS